MKNKPFFSIITCTFNSEKYLPENIQSVESQTFKDYEHIFIDAFSTDKTLQIIKEYQKRNSERVKLYQYPPKGISNAMNLGIKHANGEVIQHLHSDDYLLNNHVLKNVSSYFCRYRVNIISGKCISSKRINSLKSYDNRTLKGLLRYLLLSYSIKYLLYYKNYIQHPSTYIKKSVFERYGVFDEQLKNVMDYEYWLRITKKEKVKFVSDFFCLFREHELGTSSDIITRRKEKKKIIKRYSPKLIYKLRY